MHFVAKPHQPGSFRGQWPRIRRQLHDIGLSFDHEFTSGPGHALEIARRAIDSGHRYLIAVGGDGTVNEVANGILSSTHSRSIILGIVGCGTASSFARSPILDTTGFVLVNRLVMPR